MQHIQKLFFLFTIVNILFISCDSKQQKTAKKGESIIMAGNSDSGVPKKVECTLFLGKI